VVRGPPPRRRHDPSHFSDEDEDDREMSERHSPIERSSHLAIKYSKTSNQGTINVNCEAPVYEGSKQSRDPRFWSLFHSNWYRSIYLHKVRPVVETQWVKYDWNKEIICQFYATLYFDANG
jgi:hypothetical protein